MTTNWLDIFVRDTDASHGDRLQQRAFAITQLIALATLAPAVFILLASGGSPGPGIALLLQTLVFAALPFIQRLNGDWRLMGSIAVAWFSIMVFADVYFTGGFHSPVLPATVVPAATCALFLSGKGRLVCLSAIALAFAAIVSLHVGGHQFPDHLKPSCRAALQVIVPISATIFMTAMTWLYARVRGSAQTHLRDEMARNRDIAALLQQQWREAQQTSHNKAQHLASIGGEFAMTIRTMIGFSQLISADSEGGPEQDRYRACARDIESSGRRMLEVLQAIEGLAKAETGELKPNKEPFDLGELLRKSVSDLENIMEIGHLKVRHEIPNSPVMLTADQRMLRQAVGAILSNAVRFNQRHGEITVRLRTEDGKAKIEIADTGHGMTAEALAELRQRMKQAKERRSLEPGSGYGLQYANALVSLHDGDIGVESVADVGTKVTITLPL
jgi:signal transduction histidine kinase